MFCTVLLLSGGLLTSSPVIAEEREAATVALENSEHSPRARRLDTQFLENLREEVRRNHPTIAAANARVEAARSAVSAVRLWVDPMVGLGFMAAERSMRADDGDLMFMTEQVLPRRKLYEARKASASAERARLDAEKRNSVVALESYVAKAAIELALIDETLLIEKTQLQWLERMTINAQEKLGDPTGSASEALRIESELAQEKQKVDSMLRSRLSVTRQLNILLGRSPVEVWPNLALPGAAALTPSLSAELERLYRGNPMLQALLEAEHGAKSEVEIARREQRPIFSVGVQSSVYSGGDFRQATVLGKVTLPFFNKTSYRANVERAERERIAAEKEIEALKRTLESDVVRAHTEAETAAHQAITFSKEVIPRSEKAATSIQSAWISSKSTLLEVLESRRAMLNAQLEERRFVAAHQASLETLRAIIPPPTNE